MHLTIRLLLALLIILQTHQVFSADDNKEIPTIVVLPFEVNQEGEFAYLNKAINQMLLARLSQHPEMKVRASDLSADDRQTIQSSLQSGDLTEAAQRFDGDWIIDPSMYSLKGGMQLNLTLYPVTGGRPVSFAEKADGQDEIMGAVRSLSSQIYKVVAKQETEAVSVSKKERADDGLTGFETPHPERAYKKGLYGGAPIVAGEQGDVFESRGVRKSGTIPMHVESMAIGDLNKDGKNDLVVSSKSKIRIFTYDDLKFEVVAEYDFSPRMKIHAVNIGDPGSSGTRKLYVSGNEGRLASSAILSWNGSKSLQSISQGLTWYIRPVVMPEKGEVLIGQQTSDRTSDEYLRPGVFELSTDPANGRLMKGNKLLLPENTNLFDFVQADLNGDGEAETVVIDNKQKLLVYDSALNLIWVSNANYGGSKKYFGPQRGKTDKEELSGLTEAQQDNRRLIFIPGRLDSKDITGDGLPEVVVSTNEVGISKYFKDTRMYDGGSVACLGWFGQGLAELWQTNHIGGYVADYFFDNVDGTVNNNSDKVINRLYVAQIPVVPFWKQLMPTPESKLLAYEMVVNKTSGKKESK